MLLDIFRGIRSVIHLVLAVRRRDCSPALCTLGKLLGARPMPIDQHAESVQWRGVSSHILSL